MDKRIFIVGCGPGAKDLITMRSNRAIEEADVIIGSRRLIADFVRKRDIRTLVLENNYQKVFEDVDRLKGDKRVVFLVSGDPLFHSLGERVIERFGRESCEVIPGVSSFQYAFCQIKESWKDYRVFSIHGDKDVDIGKIFKENDRFILLLDPGHNLKFIKRQIGAIPKCKYRFYVASNLSMLTEKISNISFADFDNFPEESLSLLIVRREDE
ncbi:MAG: precorrin-6y C5,15-methyltransferase (decarboxylating) subunit CbiE [Nitrospinae bacterium]|nr:precorrin-6y C5,15-methyltransferase (decarboxylating) subunit CbiE [Nitrospinota bacterium]